MEQNFKNKKVLIMGLGLHGGGAGVAKFFCRQGAEVSVTDLKSKKQLEKSIRELKNFKINFILGKHREEDFMNSDLIIKNPDVSSISPYLEVARKNGVAVETDVSLFFKLSKAFIIGVTGTKGKSTTASLIYHLLKPKFKKLFLAGNIGTSTLEILPEIKPGDKVVLELSSFNLEDLKQSPNIAVITNILEDHLNRYKNMQDYIEAKKPIFLYQTSNDFLLLNEDDDIMREFANEAGAKIYFFSSRLVDAEGFKLMGRHNLSNLAAAVKVAEVMGIPAESIKKSVKTFMGVPSRQEFVAEINGVKYYNDTTATMPDAAEAAINAFSESFPDARLIFISGGQDKGLDYSSLAKKIKSKVGELIMLPGTASDKMEKKLSGYKKLHKVSSMEEAVKKSDEVSSLGDIVVLSPGAASFNLFENEFDRGRQFAKYVELLNEK